MCWLSVIRRQILDFVFFRFLLSFFNAWLYFLGRLLRVDLIKWVSNVCPSTKSVFNFSEIWYVGRGRQVMHDGMQYDPIQG